MNRPAKQHRTATWASPKLNLGKRLRQIREAKKLSQRDVERKGGLTKRYVSRVENGHTIPNVETLQKFANAVEVPVYQILFEEPRRFDFQQGVRLSRDNENLFHQLVPLVANMDEQDRSLLLTVAQRAVAKRDEKR